MNGSQGIVPTVDLATNNTYPYPIYYGNGNGNGFFGGDGIWALVLLALLFNGGNGWGFGGNNGYNNLATTDYISSEFTQRDVANLGTNVSNGFQNTNNLISNGFADNATNICNLRSDVLTGNMGLQNSIQDAKFASAIGDTNTQRDILLQTTQLENQLSNVALSNQAHIDSCCCDIKQAIREDGEATRALITSNTIQDLRDKNTQLNAMLSDQSVVNQLSPRPIPSYIVSSPYQSIFPYGYGYNGGFYGNGFYGNTIV